MLLSPWWAGHRVLAPLDVLHETYKPWASASEANRTVHNPLTEDALRADIPFRKLAERSLRQDGFIGWDRLQGAGRSVFDDPAVAAEDWTLQLHRFLGFWKAWHLGLLTQLVIAGAGMLFFLRSRGFPPHAAFLGGLLFVLSSQMIFSAYDRKVTGAFCWLPWIFLVADLQRTKRWLWPVTPLLIALSLAGGSFETSLVVLIALALVLPALTFREDGRLRLFESAWILLAGVGLAAFSLVPDAMRFFETGGFRTRMDIGPFNTLLVPLQLFPTMLGSPRSVDLTRALGLNLSAVGYFGFIPSIFAIRALFSRGCPTPARRLVAAGLLIPATPLVGVSSHRAQILFAIGGIWAFIWYLQERRYRSDQFIRWLTRGTVGIAVIWLMASVTASIVDEVFAGWLNRFTTVLGLGSNTGASKRLAADLMIWNPRQLVPVVSLLVCLILLRRLSVKTDPHEPPPDRQRYAALAVALGLELITFAAGWVTYADLDAHPGLERTPDIATLENLAAGPPPVRLELPPEGSRVIALHAQEAAPLFPPNTLSIFGVPDVRSFDQREPSIWTRQGELVDARALARAGVGYAVTLPNEQPADTGWSLAHDGETLRVWRNDFPYSVYSALPDPGTGARQNPSSSDNRRRVESPGGFQDMTRLVVVENWNEGWFYRASGQSWRPVRRTPEGGWEATFSPGLSLDRVEFRFDPPRKRLGLACTAMSAIAVVIALGFILRPAPVARLVPGRRSGEEL